MAGQFTSLQEVIRRRQHASFVGRDAQLAQFRENLKLPPNDPERRFIFSLHGVSGVGKTFLMQQLIRTANDQQVATAYTDESTYDIPSVMGALAADLVSHKVKLDNFAKHYTTYQKRRSELENDPNAPEGTPSFLTTTAVRIGLGSAGLAPVVGGVIASLDDAAIAEQADRLRKYISTKFHSTDIRLLLSPVEELTPLFVEELRNASNQPAFGLFFDSYERTAALLDDWLVDLLNGRYGDLPADIVITVAGQRPLDANKWIPYLDVISDVQLAPFSDTEARQLLAHRGVTNSDVVEVILALSAGLPLLVAMLAENRPTNPTYIGDPTGNAIERFLRWEGDPKRRSLALSAALPRQLNKDVLAVLTKESHQDALFEWVRKLPFVTDHSGRCTYHGIVRGSMIRVLRNESPQGWLDQHVSLALHYRRWRERLELRDDFGWSDPTWTNYLLEETYHSLCSDANVSLPEALSNAVHACKVGSTAAYRWAEMIEQAGTDDENDVLARWGSRLLKTLKDDYSYITNYLTALIEDAPLDDAVKSIALAERAEAYRLLKRYNEALADFNDAIEINAKLTWAIASRGDTYRSMGRHRDAVADFTRAIDQSPSLAWAIADRGISWRSMSHYREALNDFNDAISIDPSYAWAIANRGETYRCLRLYEQALSDFDQAIELDADYAWAIASRGKTYLEKGCFEEAVNDFSGALRIDRKLTWVYSARGRAYRAMGRFDDAIADFDRVIQMAPDDSWTIGKRGLLFFKKNWYDEALLDFDRAVDLDSSLDWVFYFRGLAHLNRKNYTKALEDFERTLEIDPTFDHAEEGRRTAATAIASTNRPDAN